VSTTDPAPAEAGASARPQARYRLSFTEEMKGFFTFGEADYETGFTRGRTARSALEFHLTIGIDDTYAFIADPVHTAPATGYVQSDPLGGRCLVERGEFNLFVDDGEVNGEPARHMRYLLWFRDAVGHPLTLRGFKALSHPARPYAGPADVWRETTTLYIHLSTGFVDWGNVSEVGSAGSVKAGSVKAEMDRRLVGAGILNILPLAFARQLSTFRVAGPGLRGRSEALGAFAGLFTGGLWDVFRPRRPVPAAG
jgi:cholesterol oxidase